MRFLFLGALAAALVTGCINDAPTAPAPPSPWPWPPTPPESLVRAIQAIYNDTVRGTEERLQAYGGLLAPDFKFCFQEFDADSAGVPCWGYKEELAAHRCMFEKQASGEIYSLRLDMQFLPAIDLDPPDPEKPGWKQIFVSNVFLELLNDPSNGWVVNDGQADFFVHLLGGRWVIAQWTDLPRPRVPGEPSTTQSTTWGQVKLAACR